MPRRQKQNGGCCGQKGSGRKKKLHAWAKKGKQRGGFLVTSLALIGSAIWAGVTAAAPAIATGALTAAASYGTTKALQQIGGRKARRRTIRRR